MEEQSLNSESPWCYTEICFSSSSLKRSLVIPDNTIQYFQAFICKFISFFIWLEERITAL